MLASVARAKSRARTTWAPWLLILTSLRPAGPDDLCQAPGVVPVGLAWASPSAPRGHGARRGRRSAVPSPTARPRATPRAARSPCPPSRSRPATARATPRSRPGRSAPCPLRGSPRRRRRRRPQSAPARRPKPQTRPCHPPSSWFRQRAPPAGEHRPRTGRTRAGGRGDCAKWCSFGGADSGARGGARGGACSFFGVVDFFGGVDGVVDGGGHRDHRARWSCSLHPDPEDDPEPCEGPPLAERIGVERGRGLPPRRRGGRGADHHGRSEAEGRRGPDRRRARTGRSAERITRAATAPATGRSGRGSAR